MSILFIHGAGATNSVWRLQTNHFRDSVAVDLPGHPHGSGRSTIEDYVRFVEQQINQLRLRDVIVVGHSMGGAIGIDIALNKQQQLRALVLVGTGARLRVLPEFLSRIEENYAEAVKLVASWSISVSADNLLVDRVADDLMRISPDVTLGDFTACDGFDRLDRVEEIAYPTLVVCGADDRMTPVKYSEYLHRKINDSKLVIIPGAGHGVMLEKHREFNQALEDFFASL